METGVNNPDFNQIFAEYRGPVLRFVMRMVKEKSIAEELTQDIFVKVHKSLSEYRAESAISTWIYRIATNTCLDYFRSKPHKQSEKTELLISEDLRESTTPECEAGNPGPDLEVINAEMSSCVRQYIEGLSEEYRLVIVLHDFEGFTNPEIAEIIGTTVENVKIRLHRARQKMKEILASRCSFYRDERDVFKCVQKEGDDSNEDE